MKNKDWVVIQKILSHINSILQYCRGYSTLEEFQKDSMCVEACVFNLMQIGELAKESLSEERKREITNIPWNQIYGMRNRIVHGYDGVKMTIVWTTIKEDLPKLKSELENVV